MNEHNREILDLSKERSTWRVTGDQLITTKPCWLFSVYVEPDNASNKTQAKLINGEISSGSVLFNLKAQYCQFINTLPHPIYFNRGLFIDFVDNVEAVTVQYVVEGK